MKKLVSVIINTRNEAKSLPALLESIQHQDYPKKEVVVVDNFSTDATAKIAKQFRAKFYQKGPERSPQKNFGVEKSKGEWLFFVDADMTLSPGLITDCVATMEKNLRLGALIVPERSVGKGFWAACRSLERECYLGDDQLEAARFFRRKIFERVGGFDEELVSFEDWDLTDRIRQLPAPIGRSHRFLNHHEGQLRLREMLRKKVYYGRQSGQYLTKIKSVPFSWSRQTPWRICYWRQRQLLCQYPLNALGVLLMKHLEFAAGGWGWLRARLDR